MLQLAATHYNSLQLNAAHATYWVATFSFVYRVAKTHRSCRSFSAKELFIIGLFNVK